MTDFEQYLASKGRPNLDKEQLQSMAKRAAAKYINDNAPLNETIEGFKKESSLNDEQVRRVVEMANTETFLQMFKQGYDKNVSFDVADASSILGGQSSEEKTASPLPVIRSSYVPGQEYVSLEDAFASSGLEKAASEDEWTATKVKEYLSGVDNAKRISAEIDEYGNLFNLQVDRVKFAFSEAVNNDGATVAEGMLLLKESGVAQETLELIAEDIEQAMERGSHMNDYKFDMDLLDFTKKASHAPNQEHPLYVEGAKLASVQEKLFRHAEENSYTFPTASES